MKCKTAQSLIGALILDELDKEAREEVEGHLKGCEGCANVTAAERDMLDTLRKMPPIETSSERRDRIVGAMKEEHGRRVEATALRKPMRIGSYAAAAVLLIGVTGLGVFLLNALSRVNTDLELTEGRALVLHPGATQWAEMKAGDVVADGDRLRAESLLKLALRDDGRETGTFEVHPQTTFLFVAVPIGPDRRIIMDRGSVRIKLTSAAGETYVHAPAGDQVRVLRGTCRITVLQTDRVAARVEHKVQPDETADVKFERTPLSEVAAAVSEISGKRILPNSEVTGRRRIDFYGHNDTLVEDFRKALEKQALKVFEADDYILVSGPDIDGKEIRYGLEARVIEGAATLRGTKGEVELSEGQVGEVDYDGLPTVQK